LAQADWGPKLATPPGLRRPTPLEPPAEERRAKGRPSAGGGRRPGMASAPGQDEPIDVEAIVNKFLQDPSSCKIELPRSLTPAQRKQIKKLADGNPDLECESYGFGEERQLHLFKKKAEEATPDRVRVKNTFIDDWEGAKGEGEERPEFRSMPPGINLLQRAPERAAEDATPPVAPEPPAATQAGQPSAGLATGGPALPPMPEGFKVRNTFITIEEVPQVDRIVQSMPDGRFMQYLQAELDAQKEARAQAQMAEGAAPAASGVPAGAAPGGAAAAPPASAAPAPAPGREQQEQQEQQLSPGTEIVIQNLVKLPDFNGLTGVVQDLDPETGRFNVLLDDPAGASGWRWVKVRGENCRPRVPPPPERSAPSLVVDVPEPSEGEGGSGGAIPPTPKWEEDFQHQANGADVKAKLKLNALV